ncbi:TatD family hydrolase [Myroides ceti]|uniref:TatD family hydrolase n=1 Tax=Paenimyroides ceti TaxID=395087 RepID=A0ABT8CWA3_9FLAO|nr:TatD family hydrolase [Paenimyroides ceti]MDN3705544.1 TatD family hydrolase [Paenimyroides ceti]MDN3708813.1 TatD family hydrolase [Paenimyroides ceti]
MLLIDTHTHLYSEEFSQDREEMIQRAIHANVKHLFVPAIDSGYTKEMYKVEEQFPDHVHLMMGLHPCYVKPNTYLQELEFVEHELQRRPFFAVGEIGVDMYWDQSTKEIQQEAFQKQIQLAKKHQLPINIHCRDAFDEVFEVLEKEKAPNLYGIFHCFSGDIDQAKKALSYNLKLGIGGVVTFKNGKIDQFLKEIPIEEIVLETDAPYLAPVPYRGKRNESSYLTLVADKLSEIYGLSLHEVADITTKNAKSVFNFE